MSDVQKIDYVPVRYGFFKCDNGKTYVAPLDCCLFCKHCSDILYDSDGPYHCICKVGKEPADYTLDRSCADFEMIKED